jgi:site-specific recombinase XerC
MLTAAHEQALVEMSEMIRTGVDRAEAMRHARKAGATCRAIALRLGITRQAVSWMLSERRLRTLKPKTSAPRIRRAGRSFNAGEVLRLQIELERANETIRRLERDIQHSAAGDAEAFRRFIHEKGLIAEFIVWQMKRDATDETSRGFAQALADAARAPAP